MRSFQVLATVAAIATLSAATPVPDQIRLHVTPQTQTQPRPQTLSRLPSLESIASELDYRSARNLQSYVEGLPEKRLLRWADGHEEWVTEGEKALVLYRENGRKFVDVTEYDEEMGVDYVADGDFPTKLRNDNKTLSDVYFSQISTLRMKTRLTNFTSFKTRHYRSETHGREAQKWLLERVQKVAASYPKSNITVRQIFHSWGQNSIVARLEPVQTEDRAAIIVGAHLDSTSNLPQDDAPGADDDGSGTMTILEVLNVLGSKQWRPQSRPVEFHWYSAEEAGMLGSGAVARAYKAAGVPVKSMLQFDMTAFIGEGNRQEIGIITDFTDPNMAGTFLKGR